MSSLKLTVSWIWKELQCNWQTHTGGRQQESRSLTWYFDADCSHPLQSLLGCKLSDEWQLMQYARWHWLVLRPRAPSCGQRGVCGCRSVRVCWELLKIYPQQKDFNWVISWWQMNKLVFMLRVICCNKQPEVTVSESWWFVRVIKLSSYCGSTSTHSDKKEIIWLT